MYTVVEVVALINLFWPTLNSDGLKQRPNIVSHTAGAEQFEQGTLTILEQSLPVN